MTAARTPTHSTSQASPWRNLKLAIAPHERLLVASVLALWFCVLAVLALASVLQL